MQSEFWLDCWQKGALGFQLDEVHPLLLQCLPSIEAAPAEVFVPLCGKSLDMLYLAQHMKVVGCELSAIACHDFFTEHGLDFTRCQYGQFSRYQAGNVQLYQGDFFDLVPEDITHCQWIYDRAALVALPADMRRQYAEKLQALCRSGTKILLIAVDYPQHEKQGPPFSVDADELQRLFIGADIQILATRDLTSIGFARRRFAVSRLIETAYLICLK